MAISDLNCQARSLISCAALTSSPVLRMKIGPFVAIEPRRISRSLRLLWVNRVTDLIASWDAIEVNSVGSKG
jgi:hypothetical protein